MNSSRSDSHSPAPARIEETSHTSNDSPFASALLIIILISEVAVLLLSDRHRLFWYDEVLTFLVSSLQPFSRVLSALRSGADGMTPAFYLMVRLARLLPGDPHVLMRIPSVLGYALTLLGVYWLARKRLSAYAGLAAVIVITLSPFRDAARDARAYTLLVGFVAMAAVCWQRIGEKRFMTLGFWVSLTLAVSCQYLNVMIISAFGLAELTWSIVTKRVRWGVWVGCVLATVPFLWAFPILLHYRQIFGAHFWAQPSLGLAVTSYGDFLGLDFKLAFALAVFIGLAIGDSLRRALRGGGECRSDQPDLVLIGSFVFYPAMLAILTKFMHSGYVFRYGWPAILGLVLGPAYAIRGIWGKSCSVFVLVALLVAFALQTGNDYRALNTTPARLSGMWETVTELSRSEPNLPVVVASPLAFLDALEEAPPELKGRLVEIVEPSLAARLVGTDTTEIGNQMLGRFVPLQIEDLATFQQGHREFLLQSGGYWDWLTPYLAGEGYRLRLLAIHSDRSLYRVER